MEDINNFKQDTISCKYHDLHDLWCSLHSIKASSDRHFYATSTGTCCRRGAKPTRIWTVTTCCCCRCCCCCRWCCCCWCSRSKSGSRPWRRCRWWRAATFRSWTTASRRRTSEPGTKRSASASEAQSNSTLTRRRVTLLSSITLTSIFEP